MIDTNQIKALMEKLNLSRQIEKDNHEIFGQVFKKSVIRIIPEENSKEGDSSFDVSRNQNYS